MNAGMWVGIAFIDVWFLGILVPEKWDWGEPGDWWGLLLIIGVIIFLISWVVLAW